MANDKEPVRNPPARPGLSRRKKWVFRVILLIVLLPVLELLSWLGLRMSDDAFSFQGLRLAQEQLVATGAAPKDRPEVVHPYMGWILNPQTHHEVEIVGRQIPVNSLGFADDKPTLQKRTSGRFLVGIIGGSVAQQLSILGEDTLRRRLEADPRLKGKQIEIVRLALSGFKEPQQLMTLNYVLSLGGELDALINIDGFNEIALPCCENDLTNVFVAYPRMWYALTTDLLDPQWNAEALRLLELRAGRQRAARAILASPIRFSATRTLIWRIQDAHYENEITALAVELSQARAQKGRGFGASGPDQLYRDRKTMFSQLADLWRESSRQMHNLCRENKIVYVHVLQPNQYVPDSKPMGKDERRTAIRNDACFGAAVREAYHLLVREGKKLSAAGVDFRDDSRLFATNSEPLYVDDCCHYNTKGYELLATDAADALLAALNRSK